LRAKLVKDILNEEEFKYFKGPSKEKILKSLEGKSLNTKFGIAIRNNISWLVQDCLEQGIDPTRWDNWSIKEAADHGHLQIVKLLLKDKRVDPSINNNRLIKWAFHHFYLNLVKELLKDKKVIDSLDLEEMQEYITIIKKYKDLINEHI
jgi:hypothetical protein